MADINPRAVELARINCVQNSAPCECLISDGFEMIQDTFDKNISGVNDYYRQLDQKKGEVRVNVTVD